MNWTSRHFATQLLPLLLLAAIVSHYFAFIVQNALNIPYLDDIMDFVTFLVALDDADGLNASVALFFDQYNDHRTTSTRLIVYGIRLVQGEINFHTLTLIANFALLLLLILYLLRIRHLELRWLWLLAASLVLLSLRPVELLLFSQASFAYYFVFFYAYACIFALHRTTPPRFLIAILFGTLATFTFASGLIVWILGAAALVHSSLIRKDQSSHYLFVWLLVAAGVLALWRHGFNPFPPEIEELRHFSPYTIQGASPTELILRYTGFFLAILGSALSDSNTAIAISSGAVVLAALAYLSLRAVRSDDIRLELCCWFVVASAAAVSIGRADWLEPSLVLKTRYSFLSLIILSSLAIIVPAQAKWSSASAAWCLVILAAAYSGWTFVHFTPQVQSSLSTRAAHFNSGQYPMIGVPLQRSNGIVSQAIERGLYVPPCRPYPQCKLVEPSRVNGS